MPRKNQSKVLVTGAAGFIGYHLANYLANQGQKLTLVDNFFRGENDQFFKALCRRPNVKFYKIDLSDRKQLNKMGRGFDYVYHLAAVNGTKFFYEIPHEVLRIDLSTTLNMLDWMIKSKSKKIMFASTCETYAGNLEAFGQLPLPTPENVPLVVSDVFNPRWSYGGSKIAGELCFINYGRNYKFDWTIIRYNNLFGPREGYEHVVPEFCMRAAQKKDPFEILGSKNTRTFCYIDDGVRASQLVMENRKTNGEVIHVGSELGEITMVELAKRLFKVTSWKPKKLKIKPAPKGSVSRRCPNISKLKKLTGYNPEVSLEEGLLKTYEWYKKYGRKKK